MSSTSLRRFYVVQQVIRESPGIIQGTFGAVPGSEFINKQLPPLASDDFAATGTQLIVELGDTIFLIRRMLEWRPEIEPNQVMLLNIANDQQVAGGWNIRIGQSQEDMMCYQSTLHATLRSSENFHPFANHLAGDEKNGCGALFSPGVVLHRGGNERKFGLIKTADFRVVSVVSIAPPPHPPSISQGDDEQQSRPRNKNQFLEKLRMILRIAATKGKTVVVLGAFGCGFFGKPAVQVARLMKSVVLENEFIGRFQSVYWFINERSTYDTFQRVIVGDA